MKNDSRQYALPGFELQDYVKESIQFLREHELPEGYFVGFSGGKDSITTLALCRMAGVKHFPYYSCTRIDPPEVMKFIRREYPEVAWLKPTTSFYELIQIKSPPMRHMRWCCDELKKKPSKNIPLKYRIMGIRAEESARRALRPRIDKYNGGQTLLKPIFIWPEWAVWEFIEAENLPYPSLYDEGFGRIGCVVCPFIFYKGGQSAKKVAIYQKRWPGIWKAFEYAIKRWFNNTMSNGLRKSQRIKHADEFWEFYIKGYVSC